MPSRTPPSLTFTKGARFTRNGLDSLKALSKSLSTEHHPNARSLIAFVLMISDPNEISATYKTLSTFLANHLTSVPDSPFMLVQAFIQLATSSSIPFSNHNFHQTSDTITATLVKPSHGGSDDFQSGAGTTKDSRNDFIPVKSKHTFSTSDRNAKVASSTETLSEPIVQNNKATGKSLEKVNVIEPLNTTNAKRSINDRTTECIKNIELLMANAKRPTRRTRHMDVKFFAIQQWVKRDLLTLARIATADDYADALTKSLGRNLHYRHMDFIMGKLRPDFASPLRQPLACRSVIFQDLYILPLSMI